MLIAKNREILITKLKDCLIKTNELFMINKKKACSKTVSFARAKYRRSFQKKINTPYDVGSVLWRLFNTLEVVQYIGGITSVLWGDSFSTVEIAQYSGG